MTSYTLHCHEAALEMTMTNEGDDMYVIQILSGKIGARDNALIFMSEAQAKALYTQFIALFSATQKGAEAIE